MSVRSSSVACCGFLCCIFAFFMCMASAGFVKGFYALWLLHNYQSSSGLLQIGNIGCILALQHLFAEQNGLTMVAAFVREHYFFFFSEIWLMRHERNPVRPTSTVQVLLPGFSSWCVWKYFDNKNICMLTEWKTQTSVHFSATKMPSRQSRTLHDL